MVQECHEKAPTLKTAHKGLWRGLSDAPRQLQRAPRRLKDPKMRHSSPREPKKPRRGHRKFSRRPPS
eukprot:4889443-Pyramimonas_sp.AAC.1